ncbi:ATP-binding cassette domain-containing protein [Microaerobacter geothermalis]|uniref:ATP-binding cassette domain-containing protein n=1 Tax=Microaerobacter geothermalis TaxID=674972 RepID=UPI001F402FB7|nr:ATP-binding cassette domain-containing protein [Microaerobacter geothermalis]MCF6092915.1 ATP-binding cassette domain-containing protein [Microaerobacter geothermalis]
MVTLKHVTKAYKNRQVLKDFSYSFESGYIYGIIGSNGSGKSTLLKMITGFETPTSGEVYYLGKRLGTPHPDFSCVWQKPYLFQTDVYANIEYGLRVRKWDKKKRKERVEEMMEQFGVSHIQHQHARTLSGGEGARVAIARAIAVYPRILILDEPTASIDPNHVRVIEHALVEINKKEKITIILVTHNMFQARRIADITLYLQEGRLIEAGPTEQIFLTPKHRETKGFISGELAL